MTFLGMGPLEVMVILLVAFMVLGPQRMMDAARLLGKATREVRRMSQGLTDALDETMEEPRVHRPGSHVAREQKRDQGTGDAPTASAPPASDVSGRSPSDDDGQERRGS